MENNTLVKEKFKQLFENHPQAETLFTLLQSYGSREGDREIARVQLALLKLSGGDAEKLRRNLEAALVDYRDVLAWAEYPEQMKSGKTMFNTLPEDYAAMLKRDRQQYEAWLDDESPQDEPDGSAG